MHLKLEVPLWLTLVASNIMSILFNNKIFCPFLFFLIFGLLHYRFQILRIWWWHLYPRHLLDKGLVGLEEFDLGSVTGAFSTGNYLTPGSISFFLTCMKRHVIYITIADYLFISCLDLWHSYHYNCISQAFNQILHVE